ncbi:uncharacterized protein [Drosophila suzukii]|uniref:Uncharacterized protein n=1 Tax=Drosophila suzukii TaxID=28584 RepID=A0ABM4TVT7_DROSZ
MLLAGPILLRLAGIILPQFLHGWRHTVSRSVFQSLDELIPAHRQSVSGALTPEKFWMNLRYQPAVPKKLRSCRVFLGTSIFIIASTFFRSVRKAPSPIMNPKYRNNMQCSSKVLDIINKSSKYTKTRLRRRCGITLSITLHNL